MPSKKILTPIETGGVYHVFNRGINYQNVFFCQQDYTFFLEKFKEYIINTIDVYAFSLMPNHYHFLLRVKDDVKGIEFSMQFKKFILAYTNIVNHRESRSGGLFLSMFKRLKVEDENYLIKLICYIHCNPEKHNLIDDFRKYKYSSYNSYLTNKSSLLNRDYILSLFEDRQNFKCYHKSYYEELNLRKLYME